MTVITTPNAPNVLPFAFSGAARKSGDVAAVPPRSEGREQRAGQQGAEPDLPVEKKARHPEPEDRRADEPDGYEESQPVLWNSVEAMTASVTAPLRTKKKIANSPWSASDPTLIPQARE